MCCLLESRHFFRSCFEKLFSIINLVVDKLKLRLNALFLKSTRINNNITTIYQKELLFKLQILRNIASIELF